jgi:chromosome segregation protein
MLKALELFGFKSFADKTRFEFPPGITVVVGPNGSGKSNIVDAIKWVLGEQSAKSLRGKEMADVIFKGSGGASSLRRPANTAEVTIVFDNSQHLLPLEAAEVRVTRRVYRSGEGEYLINGNPCRLRDVRDVFRGTGMGTDAYSLIEQGKVDTLLQASPRDRRAIFEEAAGISRFKAKKVETQRRLERVEQNLDRLKDIVDEVENQLRTVRNQATKARRYKEYTDRLKELRTQVGLVDWRRFTAELDDMEAQLATARSQVASRQQTIEQQQQRLAQVERESQQTARELHVVKAAAAQVLQDLAGSESSVSHEYQRLDELEHELQRYRRQWHNMTARAGDLGLQLQQLQQQLAVAGQQHDAIRSRLAEQQQSFNAVETDLAKCRQRRDELRDEHAHQLRIANDLSRRIGMCESELQTVHQQLDRASEQLAGLGAQLIDARAECERLTLEENSLHDAEQAARDSLNQARQSLHSAERALNDEQQQAVDLQRRFTVASERARFLQDLERRHEGLSPGVRQLLLQAQEAPLGPLASIRGMVADLIRVDVRMAPLIDAALGELSQYIVVTGSALMEQIATGDVTLVGRVGILDAATATATARPAAQHRLAADRAVLGRADQFVETDPQYSAFVQRLLGHTWCVETLQDALRLRAATDPTERFVTRAGEILEAEGQLLAGPRQSALGLVSRRSELRSLHHEIVALEPMLRETDARIVQLKQEIAQSQIRIDALTAQFDQAAGALMSARLAARTAADRLAAWEQQQAHLQVETDSLAQRRLHVEQQRTEQHEKLASVSARVAELEEDLGQHKQRLQELELHRQSQLGLVTEIKIELGKSEQRLDSLQGQLVRFEADRRERERARIEIHLQMQAAQERQRQTERSILQAASTQAELYLQRESLQARTAMLEQCTESWQHEREAIHSTLDSERQLQQRDEEVRHQLELSAHRVRMERDSLAERVRDDYEIELAEFARQAVPNPDEAPPPQRDEIDREIHDLRRRLSNIGAVNLAALEEIEALETRHGTLATQYQDLVDAKDSLARIIHKINADSRRLFLETLEAIRGNFQALFRRVFGGGHADVVLEEDADILEAGIDIVATPPGKHSLGISLLSGGERALTAVTLLLAIFQYRPSPFCVLDEVDGPLDEANIGRFVDVLTEFLQWTKFVVVTHSKKTMTAAHTLYGVTMQESGVSKRVSVRFEDVTDDGHIRPEAIQRDASATLLDAAPDDDELGAA